MHVCCSHRCHFGTSASKMSEKLRYLELIQKIVALLKAQNPGALFNELPTRQFGIYCLVALLLEVPLQDIQLQLLFHVKDNKVVVQYNTVAPTGVPFTYHGECTLKWFLRWFQPHFDSVLKLKNARDTREAKKHRV